MATLLRIDTETLPRVLVLDPPVTDAEFEALCRENDNVRLERTKEGARAHEPAHWWMDRQRKSGNRATVGELERRQRPRPGFPDSSTGFRLPDGSTLSPDASVRF